MKTNIVLFAAAAVVAGLTWAAFQTYDTAADIVIDAHPQEVWRVLSDTASYPEWNPVIVRLSGELRPGATITFENRGADGKTMTFRPTILKAEASRELRWLGHLWLPYIFDGEHYFVLTPLPGGQTRLEHGEHFRGVLVPFVRGWLHHSIKPDYARLNVALKARAEGQN